MVGGLATVLHGYARLTAAIDLIVDLVTEQAKKLIEALDRLGFHPQAPVPSEDFADHNMRASWVREKNMRVFSMVDRANPMRIVDLFVQHSIPFEDLWSRATLVELESTSV